MQTATETVRKFTLDRVKVQLESYKAFKEGKRIVVNQGGTRSGKTYGIDKLLIALAYKQKLQISITSLSFPHLRKGAMKDWREIMENSELYHVPSHIRTENKYLYPTGSYIEFFSIDDHLKVRGPGRDILFINECNLVDFDTFTQLLLRTKLCAFIDYNPADEFHWIYDKVITRSDCAFIKSTYLDNPFLPHEQIKEIENLKNLDQNFWRIYGEGERGHSEGIIYTHWHSYSTNISGRITYGLDFGYNNPTALTKVIEYDKGIYVEELLYQSHLTNPELIDMLKAILPPFAEVWCDTAEPARIEELRKAGIKAMEANKDVKAGIMFIKSHALFIHSGSVNLLKEIKSYKNRAKSATALARIDKDIEPLKLNDHLMDAMRYACTPLRQSTATYYPKRYSRDKSQHQF